MELLGSIVFLIGVVVVLWVFHGRALEVEVPVQASNSYAAGIEVLRVESGPNGIFLKAKDLERPSVATAEDLPITDADRGKSDLFTAQ